MVSRCSCPGFLFITGRIAQSVERWSNKPLVRGSSPLVTTFPFVALSCGEAYVAFVAERLRRYVQVVVLFEGVGSIPTECSDSFFACSASDRFVPPTYGPSCSTNQPVPAMEQNTGKERGGWAWGVCEGRGKGVGQRGGTTDSTAPPPKKKVMAVPGFEPGSSGSQPLMLTTTLYHHS